MKKLRVTAIIIAFWALVAGDAMAQGASQRPVIYAAPKLPKDPQSNSQAPVLSTTTVHAPIQLPDNRPKKEPKVDTKKNLNPKTTRMLRGDWATKSNNICLAESS